MPTIHPTAIISPDAELADDVSIGAYSIIKGTTRIGAGTIIHEHTHIQGIVTVGENCEIGPSAYIGTPAQHLTADRTIGQVVIGNRVIIAETATVNRSTRVGIGNATIIGDDCFIMGSGHVGHDCSLGKFVVLANGGMLGGHAKIGDKVFIGGGAAIHQLVKVGRLAIIGGNEGVTQEVIPFAAVWNNGLRGYNAIGCKRSGMPRESIRAIRAAFRCLHQNRLTEQAVAEIRATVPAVPEVLEILEFIAAAKRGLVPSAGGRRQVFSATGAGDGDEVT